jgi:hypothetical protein
MILKACLQIADFNFGIYSENLFPIQLEEGFSDFILPEISTIDRSIFVHANSIDLPKDVVLSYEAKQNESILWRIYHQKEIIYLDVFHPIDENLQQRASYSFKEKRWDIYCQPIKNHDGELVLMPLAYPMAPLIWYYLTTEEKVIMVHASGVTIDGKGRLFSGFSGVGKSTLAGIWEDKGAKIINDDRLLLRIKSDGIWMYNTPMPYYDHSKKTKLHHLYLPFHAPENSHELLKGTQGMANFLAFCIQHGYQKNMLLYHVSVVEEILEKCSIARLGVVPTASICSFIESHER